MAETEPSAELVSEISAAEPEIIGEPEFEPGSLPENLILIDDEHEAKSWPEPEPEWNTAFGEWGVAWPLHVYIFGTFYAVAFIFAFLCVMAIVKTIKLRKGKLTFSLLIMVILFNASRALSLFIEPYYAYGNVPFLTARIIWSIGLPFLTSSFSLVFLVLLDTTKMDIGPPKFQKVSMILTITVIHIGIVMTSDFIVFYEASAKAMLVVCQALFILYGLVLAIGYMFVGIKMRQNSTAGRLLGEIFHKLLFLSLILLGYFYTFLIFSFCCCFVSFIFFRFGSKVVFTEKIVQVLQTGTRLLQC